MYTDERNILDVKGRSLIHALAPLFTIHGALKSLKAFGKEVMVHIYARRITYAQVSHLSTVIKSASLSIYLATCYILTRYNRAFITKEPPK